jgi:Uma2 family endonuclease
MAEVVAEKLLTAEEFAALDDGADGSLHELLEGRLIPMSAPGPDHGYYELNLGAEIRAFVKPRKLGFVSVGEARIKTRSNPDTVRLADVLYISRERLGGGSLSGALTVPPEIVGEVVSPDDTLADVLAKVGEYLDMGVTAVLVVLPKQRQVYAYRSLTNVQVFSEGDTLSIADVLPGFALPVAEIFAQ